MSTPTSKRKLKNAEAVLAAMQNLQDTYPAVFPRKGSYEVKPLKIDIHKDILLEGKLPEIEEYLLKRSLAFWCSRKFYLKAISVSSHRYDLNGMQCGEISEDLRQNTKSRIATIVHERLLSEASSAT